MSNPRRAPNLRLHKASGLAVVTLNDKDHYLGKHGSPESQAAYDRLVSEWLARGRKPPDTLNPCGKTVNGLLAAYSAWSETYYMKTGDATSHIRKSKIICRDIVEVFGNVPVAEIRPADFIELRGRWIARKLARSTINQYFTIAVHSFRWGVENGMVDPTVWYGLKAIQPLKAGRSEARDTSPITTVDQAWVDAVIAVAGDEIPDMIRFHQLVGCRPGEVARLRGREIDRTGDVWIWQPGRHKTEHHGKVRLIPVGPKAQAILAPRLDRYGPDEYAFPAGSLRKRCMSNKTKRPEPSIPPESYLAAIRHLCRVAGVPHWTPNQLRHNAATLIRSRFGLEAAGEVLGHSDTSTTKVYAEMDLERIKQVARELG